MTTNLTDIIAIRTHFATIWDATIPVVFDNEPPHQEDRVMWARLSVSPGHQKRRSLLPLSYNQLGRIYLQVFVPIGTRDNQGWAVAENFGNAFRDLDLDDYRIRTDAPDYRSHDATDQDPYYMILVSIPYRAIHEG